LDITNVRYVGCTALWFTKPELFMLFGAKVPVELAHYKQLVSVTELLFKKQRRQWILLKIRVNLLVKLHLYTTSCTICMWWEQADIKVSTGTAVR
jgi:hypothetical protein